MKAQLAPEVRLNANVPAELHQKLKVAAAMTRQPMGDLLKQLLREPLDQLLRQGVR